MPEKLVTIHPTDLWFRAMFCFKLEMASDEGSEGGTVVWPTLKIQSMISHERFHDYQLSLKSLLDDLHRIKQGGKW